MKGYGNTQSREARDDMWGEDDVESHGEDTDDDQPPFPVCLQLQIYVKDIGSMFVVLE